MHVSKIDSTDFKQNFKIIPYQEFSEKIKRLDPITREVPYPYVAELIRSGRLIYTRNIVNNLAGGITKDGCATMFHLNTWKDHDANSYGIPPFRIDNVEKHLKKHVNLSEKGLQGFIIGGHELYNEEQLEQLKHLFESHEIPYTIIGNRKYTGYSINYGILYSGNYDTWYISNDYLKQNIAREDSEEYLKKYYNEVKLNELDKWI